MWYENDATYNPFIKTLTEGLSADLPMDWHERYSRDGRAWFCGCQDKRLLQQWVSLSDVRELVEAGYAVYEIESKEFVVEEFQTLYTERGIEAKRELAIADVWDLRR